MGQCGIERSDHQPGACRPKERDDELDGVGADEADRVPTAQTCAGQASRHVVGLGGENAIGHLHPIAGDDERPSVRAIAHVLIEEIH